MLGFQMQLHKPIVTFDLYTHMDIQIIHSENAEAFSDSLVRILIAAWRSGFRGILDDSIIEKYTEFTGARAMFLQVLESGIGTMYLAQSDGQPMGLLYWLKEEDTARIEALLTVPEAWGRGIGAALLEQAVADARSAGCSSLQVWPFAENHRARRFYEKHSFCPTGKDRIADAVETEYTRLL